MSLQFGDFELDLERRQLLCSGQPVPLEPKAYELLSLLVERRPKALSRAQIRDVVWPGVFISESTLGVAVNAIRQALGDDARQPRFIRTVHGFGYAFCGEVSSDEGVGRAGPAEPHGPYPGLSSFTEEDAEVFFGREDEVVALWERLRRRQLLALIGPSGAGKTSFLHAGVIPARPPEWGAIVSVPGRAPMTALAQALAPEVAGDTEAVKELLRFDDHDVALAMLRRWRQGHGEALLVVDQFEELFTLNGTETQARFAELLGRLSKDTDVHVLLSMRDDFLIRCHEHEALAPVFSADLTPLLALQGEELRRALVEPATGEGFAFEDESLINEMLHSVEGARGALPLLAFAVSHLWERRDRERRLLARSTYEEIGGVAGALAQHAEQTLERIGPQREPIVRELFRNLVTAQQTRAATDRDELLGVLPDPEVGVAVLDALIDARLLTSYEMREAERNVEAKERADGQAAGSSIVETSHHRIEIVHESLLRAWPRLVRWQAQDEEGAVLRDQLRQAAHLWGEKGRPDDLLWTGTSEREFEVWRERYPGRLTAVEDEFARAMVERARRRKRLRRLIAASVVTAAVVVASVTGVLWRRSETAHRRADAEAGRAEAGRLLALGEAELERRPAAALAYATKSLELADTEGARRLALHVLQGGPPAIVLPASTEYGYGDVAFSPDGEWLAGGDFPKDLLHRRDGGAVVGFDQATGAYGWADYGFGSDGRRLVGNRSGEIRIWSVPEGREVRRLEVERGGTTLFVRAEGFFTATTVGGREVVQWTSLAEGSPRLVGTTDAAATNDVDPSGRWMAYVPGALWASGRSLYIRSLADWAAPPRLVGAHPAEITDIAFHPDGRHVASADASGRIRIWEAEGRTAQPSRILDCPGVIDLEYSPRGRWLAAAGAGETTAYARLWDLEAPSSIEPLRFPIDSLVVNTWAFDPSERWLAKLGPLGITFWPLGETYPRSVGRHDWFVEDVAFTPDGSTLVSAAGTPDGTVRARSLSPGGAGDERVLLRTALNGPRLAIDPGGKQVVVSGFGPASVLVVPLSGGPARELKGLSASAGLYAVAFSPDGRRVAASAPSGPGEEKVVRVWDLEDGREQVLGPLPDAGENLAGAIRDLAFVDDERLVSSGSSGVVLFNRREGGHRRLSPRPGRGMAVDRRGGTVLAILGEPEEIVRLRLDGREPTRIAPCAGCISLAVDPTGTLIATGGEDGIVRILSASGGEPHLFFGRATLNAQMVAFSPDGRWVASSGERNHVRLWPVPDVTQTPWHLREREAVLAALRSWTNLRAIRDPESATGWTLEPGPFPGWEKLPNW